MLMQLCLEKIDSSGRNSKIKISCWEKMENKKISVHYHVGCSGSGNGRWN